MSFETEEYFIESIKQLGLIAKKEHLDLFALFYHELIKWNSHTNLTRITEEKDFIEKHLLDSLSCIKALDISNAEKKLKVIDIGTGAGFPLLPLLFFFPQWKITLVDSVNKKLEFIKHFTNLATENFSNLKKENIEIVHSRAEDLAKSKSYRENFDLCISRAVAKLVSLSELCMPFIKINGTFIAMKGPDIDEEIKEAKKVIILLGGKIDSIVKFELLNTGLNRAIISVKKIKKTNSDFPRKPGMAQKAPII